MSAGEEILRRASSVVVVDWPSPDVPDTLAATGYDVYVKGGPEPDAFSIRELQDGQPVARPLGHAPDRVEVVYCHRPLGELPAIVAMAAELGAGTLWYQSGCTHDGARAPTACWLSLEDAHVVQAAAESAGLRWVTDEYIADVARRI